MWTTCWHSAARTSYKPLPRSSRNISRFQNRLSIKSCDFLGCRIRRLQDGTITMDQNEYTLKLLQPFEKIDFGVKDYTSPLPVDFVLDVQTETGCDSKEAERKFVNFQKILGRISYLRYSRSDILFAIHAFSRYKRFSKRMELAFTHLLGYLRSHSEFTRKFYSRKYFLNFNLTSFSDASHGGEKPAMRNTGGFAIFYGPIFISGQSSTQRFITTSSGEAELRQIAHSSKRLLFFKGFIEECRAPIDDIGILIDSKSCLSTINFPTSQRFKFLSIYIAFVKELVERISLLVVKIPRSINLADLFTRQGSIDEFKSFMQFIQQPFCWKTRKD